MEWSVEIRMPDLYTLAAPCSSDYICTTCTHGGSVVYGPIILFESMHME